MKLTKMLDLLTRPTGFEPVTLGLGMQGIGHTNDTELYRFVIFNNYFTKYLRKLLKVFHA